ncbi:hypothetical protein F2Q69_00024401 [Brassica cretica]|uniref:Uncharacterized protein n=1 Tax=Brassica cretica TaxID=69181 RepID=A0A8S9QCZ1_BRACR|nr:hypothetical protein F2Q69_00024401 [Brassica cretica]
MEKPREEHRLQVDRFPIRDKPSLEDWSLNVKVSVMIGLGEVQLSPTYYHNSCRSHRALRLPSHNIVTPACTTTFIFPSSTLQITLALVAPLLRLLLVFDCLRKLMLVIISMEPKTVTMSLLCTVVALSAQSNEYSRTGVYGSTLLDQASFMEYSLSSCHACRRTSTFHTCLRYARWSRGLLPQLSFSAHLFVTLSSSGSLLSQVLVSYTNHFQTLLIGLLIVSSYPDFSMFLGTSVSGSQVKHFYGYFHPSNTSISLIAVVVFGCRLVVEFTSNSLRFLSV